jgi:hypothetical protein
MDALALLVKTVWSFSKIKLYRGNIFSCILFRNSGYGNGSYGMIKIPSPHNLKSPHHWGIKKVLLLPKVWSSKTVHLK